MAEAGNNYELMLIIDPGIGQASIDARLETTRKQIAKFGKIFFEDLWGEKNFAYSIKGLRKGYYAVLDFSFEPKEILEFETTLRLEPEVVRHLLVKLPLKYVPRSLEEIQKVHLDEAAVKEAASAAKLAK